MRSPHDKLRDVRIICLFAFVLNICRHFFPHFNKEWWRVDIRSITWSLLLLFGVLLWKEVHRCIHYSYPRVLLIFFFLNMKFLHILKDTHHENWYSYMPRWKWNSLVFLFLDWIYDNTEPIVGVLSQYVIYMLIHEIWVKSGIWGQRWWWWGLIFWLTLPILVDRSRRVKFRIYRNTRSSLI